MNPYLIDTHCHLHFPAYDVDRAEVLARMKEKNIWGITVGTGLKNSASALRFASLSGRQADATDGIFATVGLHPEHVSSDFHDEQEGEKPEKFVAREQLVEVASASKKCVAIGETGLDWYRIDKEKDVEEVKAEQEKILHEHLAAAQELDLPVIFHCREALARLVDIVRKAQSEKCKVRGVVHSFTGTWEEAEKILELGLYIGVNGIATFPPRKGQDASQMIDRTIERMPLDRLLLETDAPYLAPAPYRGKRNEPAYVEEVAKHVAKVRGVSVEEIAEQTTKNARELFRVTNNEISSQADPPTGNSNEPVFFHAFDHVANPTGIAFCLESNVNKRTEL